jgi:hypothetical protein
MFSEYHGLMAPKKRLNLKGVKKAVFFLLLEEIENWFLVLA